MEKIFSSTTMPASATSLFSAYASFTATMMIVRTMANDLVPPLVMSYFQSFLNYLFTPRSNTVTIKIEDISGMIRNQVYDSASIYLRTKTDPNTERLTASKTKQHKKIQIGIEKGEEIRDRYGDIDLKWKFVAVENEARGQEKRHFELSFSKKHKSKVVEEYLPFVLAKAKEIKDNDRSVKLFTMDCGSFDNDDDEYQRSEWGFIYLEHPSNFDTLAMEPEAKKAIIDDLDRFLRRKEFYKKVGKAWKRGYLLYGPPGTGKSSLIAAMANYLKFDIYDLELSSIHSDSYLRRVLVSTTNRSIMVIEDIDCTVETRDRESEHEHRYSEPKITLSGLLNFIDGLWSSCGDERIIIFTTNHKERLDPALLRPGRMDMHIHMSYCTFNGFKLLASNYLSVKNHKLYSEIEGLMAKVEVTPATLAEELMRSEDADVALRGVVDLLKEKNRELNNSRLEIEEVKEKNVTKSARNKRRKGRKANRDNNYSEDLVV